MIQSKLYPHVVWFDAGEQVEDASREEGWYFWDEVGMLGGGPYATEFDAQTKLNLYCHEVLNHPEGKPTWACKNWGNWEHDWLDCPECLAVYEAEMEQQHHDGQS